MQIANIGIRLLTFTRSVQGRITIKGIDGLKQMLIAEDRWCQAELLHPLLHQITLLHRVLRRVAFARVHDVFHFLALLVANLQRTAVRRLQFDFQLAIGSVEFGVGGVVSDGVLVADVGGDVVKKLRQLALEARGVLPPTGQLSESFELILILQPSEFPYSSGATGRIHEFPMLPSDADGIDRDVFGGLNLLCNLIQG